MKLQPDALAGVNVLTRHAPGSVWVGATEYRHAIVVPWTGAVQAWAPDRFVALEAAHFEPLTRLGAAVLIIGTGARQRFPPAQVLRALIERGIGFETMDTGAACRTYNVLAAEGRAVVAALLVETEPD